MATEKFFKQYIGQAVLVIALAALLALGVFTRSLAGPLGSPGMGDIHRYEYESRALLPNTGASEFSMSPASMGTVHRFEYLLASQKVTALQIGSHSGGMGDLHLWETRRVR